MPQSSADPAVSDQMISDQHLKSTNTLRTLKSNTVASAGGYRRITELFER